jgi:phosphoserine aminotransferase
MAEAGANLTYNFCSGPAMLPEPVLVRAQSELLSFQGLGISEMEMSHRSPQFLSILDQAENNLRKLMDIPPQYSVLFMQGGASLQFSAVPLNLANKHGRVGFINTGYWSQKAMAETARFADVVEIASSVDSEFKQAVYPERLNGEGFDYIHFTPNETIGGVEFFDLPDCGNTPLVADMSSCILSRPIDVKRFGLIYAGAQKNIGPAGLAVVVVRNDLIGRASDATPRLLNYQTVISEHSMANTPPTFAIYLANLVFEWLIVRGGVKEMERKNQEKATLLYSCIDGSQMIFNDVEPSSRSRMNVPFQFYDETLLPLFLASANEHGLLNLQGHRSSGGCRASIYNAMPIEGVVSLIEFIKEFEKSHVK